MSFTPNCTCAGFEARGLIFGAPVALALKAAFVPLRKPKKLPGACVCGLLHDCHSLALASPGRLSVCRPCHTHAPDVPVSWPQRHTAAADGSVQKAPVVQNSRAFCTCLLTEVNTTCLMLLVQHEHEQVDTPNFWQWYGHCGPRPEAALWNVWSWQTDAMRGTAGPTLSEEYITEYSTDKIEMHVGAVQPGQRVLLVRANLPTPNSAACTRRISVRLWVTRRPPCGV